MRQRPWMMSPSAMETTAASRPCLFVLHTSHVEVERPLVSFVVPNAPYAADDSPKAFDKTVAEDMEPLAEQGDHDWTSP